MASRVLALRLRRPLMAWGALFRADVAALSRSWVLRGWLIVLAIAEFVALSAAVVASRGVSVPGSTVLSAHLQGFLFVWSAVVIVLSAGSVSLEADIVADSILSRACTRTQYVLAKLLARAAVIGAVFAISSAVAGYVAWRYTANDMTFATIALGTAIVGLAVLMLVCLGVAASVLLENTVVAVIALLLLWYVAAPVFNFLGAAYLSPTSLTGNLPRILRDAEAPQVVYCTATRTSLTVAFSKGVVPEKAEQLDNYTVECPPGTRVTPETAVYDRTRTCAVLSGLDLPAGERVKVTVSGVTDTAGNDIAPAGDTATAAVAGTRSVPSAPGNTSKAALAPGAPAPGEGRRSPPRLRRGGLLGRNREPLRVLKCVATQASLKVTFSRDVAARDAERLANYTIESPLGKTHSPRTAVYDSETRTVLLSGLSFAEGDPVKVTVEGVRDLEGRRISPRHNSATYTEVTTWKYLLGFGAPALFFSIVAVVAFWRRDL